MSIEEIQFDKNKKNSKKSSRIPVSEDKEINEVGQIQWEREKSPKNSKKFSRIFRSKIWSNENQRRKKKRKKKQRKDDICWRNNLIGGRKSGDGVQSIGNALSRVLDHTEHSLGPFSRTGYDRGLPRSGNASQPSEQLEEFCWLAKLLYRSPRGQWLPPLPCRGSLPDFAVLFTLLILKLDPDIYGYISSLLSYVFSWWLSG